MVACYIRALSGNAGNAGQTEEVYQNTSRPNRPSEYDARGTRRERDSQAIPVIQSRSFTRTMVIFEKNSRR